MLLWALLAWASLTVARDRLSSTEGGGPTLRDTVLARGTAFVAATLMLGALALLMTIAVPAQASVRAAALSWAICVSPLVLPTVGRPGTRLHLSHGSLILASLLLTVAAGLALAGFLLASLLRISPAPR